MAPANLGKILVFIGVGIVVLGLIIWLGGKLGLPLGKLPGDVHIQKGKMSVYFPVITCILVSVGLTILINLLLWIFRK
jgi:uncharacterized protein HemY